MRINLSDLKLSFLTVLELLVILYDLHQQIYYVCKFHVNVDVLVSNF